MKFTKLLFSLATIAFTACEGPEGPPGPQGPQGNANVGAYQFSLNLSGFYHYSSTDVWGEPAPSSFPELQSDQLALVYIWMDPVSSSSEWVQQPYVHYFNGGTVFNEFFHGIETDGDLWLYIRNSTSGQPFTSMTGSVSYKVFVIESRMQHEMASEGIDQHDINQVFAFFDRRGYVVEAR